MSSMDFKLHQPIEIIITKSRLSSKSLKGKVVYISDHFITVQGEHNIKESFSFIDFTLGKFHIKN